MEPGAPQGAAPWAARPPLQAGADRSRGEVAPRTRRPGGRRQWGLSRGVLDRHLQRRYSAEVDLVRRVGEQGTARPRQLGGIARKPENRAGIEEQLHEVLRSKASSSQSGRGSKKLGGPLKVPLASPTGRRLVRLRGHGRISAIGTLRRQSTTASPRSSKLKRMTLASRCPGISWISRMSAGTLQTGLSKQRVERFSQRDALALHPPGCLSDFRRTAANPQASFLDEPQWTS
jgi:hypothetical protein